MNIRISAQSAFTSSVNPIIYYIHFNIICGCACSHAQQISTVGRYECLLKISHEIFMRSFVTKDIECVQELQVSYFWDINIDIMPVAQGRRKRSERIASKRQAAEAGNSG